MNILVIGGTRFIGAAVVRQLAEAGHAVTVYHRGEHEGKVPCGIRHVRRPEAAMPVRSFPAELLSPAPDVTVHMMAMGEADAGAAVQFLRGRTARMVWISSGDVYLAYGRFIGIEPGPVLPGALREDAPLRTVLYPYHDPTKAADDIANIYEKIIVERIAMSSSELPGTVLRLPKVYGPGDNADLATVYGFREHPHWRWTHGYVENVARAIVLAALSPAAAGRIYNVGEEHTPTVAERLLKLPASSLPPNESSKFNFEQDIAYDTTRIREELGYAELVPEEDAMRSMRGRA
ncbi:MAG TPA: NAD-dependent epimerase/dehydratase family protein [Terriglobales bacterium]|nr:NAD-dependent epimerase/dehydratase family protein [Terriglobales bacterium]